MSQGFVSSSATHMMSLTVLRTSFGMRGTLHLAVFLLLSAASESNSSSPPGKPVLLSCRSPEKETFTCWWEPGSDGGLPTTHRLYYGTERLEGTHECPDYQSGGKNSCFFDKNHTCIWVDYYLTVVASNALGNATSDPLKFEVMDIVKPGPPENVSMLLKDIEDSPHLLISWQPPNNTDTKSGWVTIKYELRVKQRGSKWKEYRSGTQTHFSLYSVSPGVECRVQVRCRLDHSSWSEWSNTSSVKIPNYLQNTRPFWTLLCALSVVLLVASVYIVVIRRKHLKQCVLPPVPGPKIRGVDFHLLKSGPPEDVINSLKQTFPLMVAWKDQMEDYLIVTEHDNRLQHNCFISQDNKNSFMFPVGLCLPSEIQSKESRPSLNEEDEKRNTEINKSDKSFPGMSLSNTVPTQQPVENRQSLSINLITGATDQSHDAGKPFTNSSYVEFQRQEENKQEVDVKQLQYSRVKETNTDNTLILEKENVTVQGYECVQAQRQEESTSEGYSRVKDVEGDCVVILQKQTKANDTCCKEKSNAYIDWDLQRQRQVNEASMMREVDSGYVDTLPSLPFM